MNQSRPRLQTSFSRYLVTEAAGQPRLVKPEAAKPKRVLFEPAGAILNAPPVEFLIEDFLQRDGATGLVAKVASRKSIVAANITHALLTKEPLFGRFAVRQQPERVIYLCPEVGNSSLRDRFERIGLLPFIASGKLLMRTLNSEGHLRLDDGELKTYLPGSVVFLDTAIRFMEGSDTDPDVIRDFVTCVFGLQRHGALASIIIHHSTKMTGDDMTLENMVRGGGDLGAFMSCCWGTKMHEAGNYDSLSFFKNLKPRDFETPAFNCSCDRATLRMTAVDGPVISPHHGSKAGNAALLAIVKAHLDEPATKTIEALADAGIKCGQSTLYRLRAQLKVG